jgi:hypothetical protein
MNDESKSSAYKASKDFSKNIKYAELKEHILKGKNF